MIEILQHLQKYVPKIHRADTIFIPSTQRSVSKIKVKQHRIILGGDQLTVARTRGAQVAMTNAHTPSQKIDGLIPIVQDWHAEVVLIEVSLGCG